MRGDRGGYLSSSLGLAFAGLLAIPDARAQLMPGPCPPQDLEVILNTGWDQYAETAISSGPEADDDWRVILDASPGPTPRQARVRDAVSAWLTLPESKWITGTTLAGALGVSVYEYCWCMDDDFTNPLLQFAIRADDQADVRLNGFNILSLPSGTFNDPIAIGVSVVDPTKFFVGLNCLTVHVQQEYVGSPHGFDLTGTVTADDGRCCGCFDLPPDAEAWWRLDETTGTTAFDSVDGHDGTYTEFSGTGLPPTPFLGEHVVNSLNFDGIDDYVDVPDDPGLDFGPGDDLTIDAWINTTNPLRAPIVNKKEIAFNSPGYAFMVGGGVLTFEMADGTTTVTCNGGSGLDVGGVWRFVAVTLDRDDPLGLKLYVDGLQVAECDPTPAGDLTNALTLQIGARPSALLGAMWWRGRLDEIEIFRRALTPTEILELKVAGEAGKCPPPPPPTPCVDSDYPVCDGVCPPGETCIVTPLQTCTCDPLPCGAQGDLTCDGFCPQGLVCEQVPGGSCTCVEEFPACQNTVYPACDGICPQGERCVNLLGTDNCRCEPEPNPCGDPLYPACNGTCPANEKCVARDAPVPGCECTPCPDLGPSGLGGIVIKWPAVKTQLRWTGALECALVYNTYRYTGGRLPDANADGLADDYGNCYAGDIIGLEVSDPSAPPPGQVHWYLVTGEDFVIEGSLGTNGDAVERPNQTPCP